MRVTLLFDEDYFNSGNDGYKDYRDFPYFLKRAKFIKEVLQAKKIIVLGGAYGFLTKHLLDLGVESVTIDNSDYAYKQKTVFDENYIKNDIINLSKYTVFTEADWIVSWNVLDCLNESNVDGVCNLLNSFKGKQLHLFSCSEDDNSKLYIELGYFIKSHDYWKTKIPTANLACVDCNIIVSGDYTSIPISDDKVIG